VIVDVRPTGEPARSSCSAQGLPSPELDPAPLRWELLIIERRSGVVRTERGEPRSGAIAVHDQTTGTEFDVVSFGKSIHDGVEVFGEKGEQLRVGDVAG
jgi:hypothetical protein